MGIFETVVAVASKILEIAKLSSFWALPRGKLLLFAKTKISAWPPGKFEIYAQCGYLSIDTEPQALIFTVLTWKKMSKRE